MKNFRKGLSLIEMIVTVGVVSVVMVGIVAVFSISWKSQRYQFDLARASLTASRGVANVVKQVRQAQQGEDGSYLFVSGDEFDIVFFGDVDYDDTIEKVHYYLSGGVLYRGVREPSGTPLTYASGDGVTTAVASNVVNIVSEPVFEYYDGSGSVLSTPVSASDVRMVRVRLFIDVDPYVSPLPVRAESISTMRNLVNF